MKLHCLIEICCTEIAFCECLFLGFFHGMLSIFCLVQFWAVLHQFDKWKTSATFQSGWFVKAVLICSSILGIFSVYLKCITFARIINLLCSTSSRWSKKNIVRKKLTGATLSLLIIKIFWISLRRFVDSILHSVLPGIPPFFPLIPTILAQIILFSLYMMNISFFSMLLYICVVCVWRC